MSLIEAALRGVAARLAAESATDAELAEIEAAYGESVRPRKRTRPAKPVTAGSELRHEFHQLIVRASHNPSLIDMVATAKPSGAPCQPGRKPPPAQATASNAPKTSTAAIVAALKARDGERAETAHARHTLSINEAYLDVRRAARRSCDCAARPAPNTPAPQNPPKHH